MTRYRSLLCLIAIGCTLTAAHAAERQSCVLAQIVLWGDGRHDDTTALNAWLHGASAIWAESGEPVGAAIAGHSFRLSAAVYVRAGAARRLDGFRMVWPERGETVSGGSISSSSDPAQAPIVSGIRISGGDPGEGVPFDAPDAAPSGPDDEASCATS